MKKRKVIKVLAQQLWEGVVERRQLQERIVLLENTLRDTSKVLLEARNALAKLMAEQVESESVKKDSPVLSKNTQQTTVELNEHEMFIQTALNAAYTGTSDAIIKFFKNKLDRAGIRPEKIVEVLPSIETSKWVVHYIPRSEPTTT